jgi:hypothetical protein
MAQTIDQARKERVSEVDPMNTKSPLPVRRRTERQRAARFKSLSGRIVAAAERTLHSMFNNNRPLIPIPVRTADRRRLDRSQSQ